MTFFRYILLGFRYLSNLNAFIYLLYLLIFILWWVFLVFDKLLQSLAFLCPFVQYRFSKLNSILPKIDWQSIMLISTLCTLWCNIGPALAHLWVNSFGFCAILAQLWHYFGASLAHLWCDFNAILVQLWHSLYSSSTHH